MRARTVHAAPDAVGNCIQNYGRHCYANVTWPNAVLGSITEITTVGLCSVNNGSDHISNEMWDIDSNAACPGNGPASWVETGEATRRGQTGNWYFWAYRLPNVGYVEKWQNQPPGGDVGHSMKYLVTLSGGTYYLDMVNTSTVIEEWYGSVGSYSTVPNNIQIGVETTNNNYSVTHSDEAYFTANQWEGSPNGGWDYQGNPGSVFEDIPPGWGWQPPPPSNSYPGGLGSTTCC